MAGIGMPTVELLIVLVGQLIAIIVAIWTLFRHVLRPTIDAWIDARTAPLARRVGELERWRSRWDSELARLEGTIRTRLDYADKGRDEMAREISGVRKNLHDLRNWLMTDGGRRG